MGKVERPEIELRSARRIAFPVCEERSGEEIETAENEHEIRIAVEHLVRQSQN